MTVTRGTTNGNARGSYITRARRRAWLLETYAADVHIVRITWGSGDVTHLAPTDPALEEAWLAQGAPGSVAATTASAVPTARCYRCGKLLADMPDHQDPNHITVDRIVPGCQGGTYRRTNIRPACAGCNSETGGATRSTGKARSA